MIIDTPKLAGSLKFYKELGFTLKKIDGFDYVSDGKVTIRLNHRDDARLGLILFSSKDNGKSITSPSGARLTFSSSPLPNPVSFYAESGITGNFAGISLESTDFGSSVNFWESLDFKISMGAADQGWLVLTRDDGSAISLLKSGVCPHLFFNPSLSYFNGEKNLEIIEKIRKKKIPITQEITAFNKEGIVDNIIIRDPAGLGFFIFSD